MDAFLHRHTAHDNNSNSNDYDDGEAWCAVTNTLTTPLGLPSAIYLSIHLSNRSVAGQSRAPQLLLVSCTHKRDRDGQALAQ